MIWAAAFFIYSRASVPAKVVNNIFIGGGTVFHGVGELTNNLLAPGKEGAPTIEQSLFDSGDIKEHGTRKVSDAGLVDVGTLDVRLKPGSPAMGGGADPGQGSGVALTPTLEYVHPAQARPIHPTAPLDIGAYQHGN